MTVVPPVPPVANVRGLTKAFPGVVASVEVTVAFFDGWILCSLGGNGAGKFMLANVLVMRRPDAGQVLVDSVEGDIGSPRAALDHGISHGGLGRPTRGPKSDSVFLCAGLDAQDYSPTSEPPLTGLTAPQVSPFPLGAG